jgi:hypothetical protein
MKLLMENWRKFLNERDEKAIAAVDNVLDVPDYEEYVSQLGTAAADPRVQAILRSGLEDGNRNDEKVGVSPGGGPCTQFFPIQNEIDLSKSLGYPATKDPSNVAKVLAGGPITAGDFGGSPIISAVNTYIVDGHHRWSQVYMLNPQAAIETMDIKISDPEAALRAMQAAIAVVQKRVPSAEVKKGMNVFTMEDEVMVAWMDKNFSDKFVQIYIENSKAQDKRGVIKQILANIHTMRKNNPPQTDTSRGNMPQTGKADTIDSELRALAGGVVNWKGPAE